LDDPDIPWFQHPFGGSKLWHFDPMASHKAHLPLVLLWLCGLVSPPAMAMAAMAAMVGGISDPGSWIPLKNI